MILSSIVLFAALTSSDAIMTLLNSRSATTPARYEESLELVTREADAGKPLQQFLLGVTIKDASAARKYLDASRDRIKRLAAEKNNPLAWYLLSLETHDTKFLKIAADGGNVQALNAYGSFLIKDAFDRNLSSNKLEEALSEGYSCFKRAVKNRDPNALINLGTCYLRGFGCEINHMLAHECFRSAAQAGHPDAMDYLSANYELGHGVEKNHELSLFWRMKARAMRGDKAAEEWLKK